MFHEWCRQHNFLLKCWKTWKNNTFVGRYNLLNGRFLQHLPTKMLHLSVSLMMSAAQFSSKMLKNLSKWAGPAKIFIRQIFLWIHQMLATILSLLVFRIDWYWSKPFYISNINWLILAKSLSFSHTNLLILIESLRLFMYKSTGFH